MDEKEQLKGDEKAEAYMPKKEKPRLKMSRYTLMLMPDSTDELKTYEITIDKIARYAVLAVALIIIIASLIVSFAVKNYRLKNDSSLRTVIDNLYEEKASLEEKNSELTEIISNAEITISDLKARISELELETAGLYIPNLTPYKGSALMISDIIVKGAVSYNCLEGATVVATANGTVTDISENMYGTTITVDHQNGYVTQYTFRGKIKTKLDDLVVRGEAIGEILADDETISYVVLLNDNIQDPMDFLNK